MVSRRVFFKLIIITGGMVAGLIPWPIKTKIGHGSKVMLDSLSLQFQPSAKNRLISEVLKHPAIVKIDISDHVDFNDAGFFSMRAIGWSEEYQREFYCILEKMHEAVLENKDGFDMVLNGVFYVIEDLLKTRPQAKKATLAV